MTLLPLVLLVCVAYMNVAKCISNNATFRYTQFKETLVKINKCSNSRNIVAPFIVSTERECLKACIAEQTCRKVKLCNGRRCTMYSDGENCPERQTLNQCKCFVKKKSCTDAGCSCQIGHYGNNCEKVIEDCSHGSQLGYRSVSSTPIKLSYIKPLMSAEPFEILCDFRDSGMTIFLRRNHNCIGVDFNRTMEDYVLGFGDSNFEYWLGLEKLKQILLNHSSYKLYFNIWPKPYHTNRACNRKYEGFRVGNASEKYAFHVSNGVPTNFDCGESILGNMSINGQPFSTYDEDSTDEGCATSKGCGWWFITNGISGCTAANLNGGHGNITWLYNLTGLSINILNAGVVRE
ncbi:hypothetical protein SNE40_021941 [Patella caerulea]|uniref:Fibrinogen C-terminal domain-containing protein n=1 Tax=Patella caerulea TaxID=87958 RepID=A0AAN8J4E2_PATCE